MIVSEADLGDVVDADAICHEVKDLSAEAFITLATNARLAQCKTALQKALTVPRVDKRSSELRSLRKVGLNVFYLKTAKNRHRSGQGVLLSLGSGAS